MATIGVIGAGNVGGALGKRFKEQGHTVRWGVRDPSNPKYLGMGVSSIGTATANAYIVLLAVPWTAAEGAIKSVGYVSGKILIDATNAILPDFSGLIELRGSSAGEQMASWAPEAKVVKAFNTVGSNIMENPDFDGKGASMFVASDHADAKQAVMELAKEIGFEPVDAGGIKMSRHLEAFAWIWISLAVRQGLGRDIVLQLLKR
jgi:predicted dinucleotide-binding enzyme